MRAAIIAGLIAVEAVFLGALPARAASDLYVVRHESWSAQDEQGWRDFVAAIGASDCATLDACLHGAANPFRDSDRRGAVFESDCADLPYVLRFYYAWKRSLPFSFESALEAIGPTRDIRYSKGGNAVAGRTDAPSGVESGYAILQRIRDAVSSASYRIHPDRDGTDLYPPKLDPGSIRAGSIVYDAAGHVGIVHKVDAKGRIHFFDAHTDYSLTETTYDLRFARDRPAVGAGFKNWRPIRLVGATRRADGALIGGHIALAANKDIPDYSEEQFYGNGKRPADADWKSGSFTLNGETLDYYDYVRAQMAGGKLEFEPVAELREIVRANCSDLHYRAQAVSLALAAGIQNRAEPQRLPENIYGTEGDWETYSTPSRDARLKTEFKALRDLVQRFVEMQRRGDPHLVYTGDDLVGDLLKAYDRETRFCFVGTGSAAPLAYEEARKRLFAMSFDPYQCLERRWGGDAPCRESDRDGADKQAWYAAEQGLRNQLERTYDARMDFTLDELRARPVPPAPDTDVRAYLVSQSTSAP
ncbi:MAG TPA: hypothetical protein VG889_06235 [Rhizomicrobium sp.]|nr:hypothetical protein [Rhizomicrobium sp.]